MKKIAIYHDLPIIGLKPVKGISRSQVFFAKLTLIEIEMFRIKASIYICPSGLQNEMRVHVNASIVAAL